MLDAVERQKILVEWNKTDRSYPADLTIEQLFEVQVSKTPKAVAVICGDETITYGELNRRADYLAFRLQASGLVSGDVVGLCFYRSIEHLISVFAVLKVGSAFVPLEPDNPESRLQFQLEDSGAKLLLSHSGINQALTDCSVERIFVDEINWMDFDATQKAFPITATADDLMYILYTSGSTGNPKGVRMPRRGIINLMHWIQEAYGMVSGDRSMQSASISFDNSMAEVFWPLLNGGTIVVAHRGGQRNIEYILNTILEKNVTHYSTVPSMLRALLDLPQISECNSLKLVFAGGEALTEEINDKFHATLDAELHNWYGLTETSVNSIVWKSYPGAKPIRIGNPVSNTKVYLLDKDHEPVGIGIVGEIYLSGVCLAEGYQNLPELTEETFITNPLPEGRGERLYKTGDLAKYHPDGTIEFLGRIDHQIQLRGYRIEVGEIESLLNRRRDIREAAVVLLEHGLNDSRLHAYYVPAPGAIEALANELKPYLSNQLPAIMIPSTFEPMKDLPHTLSGKLDRKTLVQNLSQKTEIVRPSNGQSDVSAIATIFEEVLHCGPVSETDSFFDLGGHSLLATKIRNRISKLIQVNFPLSLIFDHPTPLQLSEQISLLNKKD